MFFCYGNNANRHQISEQNSNLALFWTAKKNILTFCKLRVLCLMSGLCYFPLETQVSFVFKRNGKNLYCSFPSNRTLLKKFSVGRPTFAINSNVFVYIKGTFQYLLPLQTSSKISTITSTAAKKLGRWNSTFFFLVCFGLLAIKLQKLVGLNYNKVLLGFNQQGVAEKSHHTHRN